MRFLALLFVAFVAFTAVMAAPQGQQCSPWLGYCQTTDQCCRHLVCSSYQAKCVPKGGIVVPGEDKRPIGDGPFPPNYPTNP